MRGEEFVSLSDRVFDHRHRGAHYFDEQGPEITDRDGTLPTMNGMPDSCFADFTHHSPEKLNRQVNYEAGGIFVWGPVCIDDRGDLNCNGLANEIDDVETFIDVLTQDSAYLKEHGVNLECAYPTSVVDKSGLPLQISSLDLLTRRLTRDDRPPNSLEHGRNTIHITQHDDIISVDRHAGAALFVFDGDVPVILLQEQMELRTGMRDGHTYALVYDISESVDTVAQIHAGELLQASGRLDSVAAAEYHGERLDVKVKHAQSPPKGSLTLGSFRNMIQGGPVALPITYSGSDLKLDSLNLTLGIPISLITELKVSAVQRTTDTQLKWEYEIDTVYLLGESEPYLSISFRALTIDHNLKLHDDDTLALVTFQLSNDRTHECRWLPVRWLWLDCESNQIATHGSTLSSRNVSSPEFYDRCGEGPFRRNITDYTTHFPTTAGKPLSCPTDTKMNRKTNSLDFYSGGGQVVCADTIDIRGDCNSNGISGDPEELDCWINGMLGLCNDSTCSLESCCIAWWFDPDFVLHQLINYKGEIPCPRPDKVDTLTVSSCCLGDGEHSTYSVDSEVGAMLFTFADSGSVTPHAPGMINLAGTGMGESRGLIYTNSDNTIMPGAILTSNLPLLRILAVTPDGRNMEVILDFPTDVADQDTSTLPENFSLQQNYPNPYNPQTTISFDLPRKTEWDLTVYNITGQIIDSYSGVDGPGSTNIHIYSADWASGMYLYRFTAGEFTASKKMVLLK